MADKKIMIVAGEASGDMHGANLIKAMRNVAPDLDVTGMGGAALVSQGMKSLYDASRVSVVGLFEVFNHLADIREALRILENWMVQEKPALLILIDFPDFNMMLAKRAKAAGIPVFYYISPQVWAWRSGRVRKIKRLVDRLAVILPFEKKFYQEWGMDVDFVGHPLLDTVKPEKNRRELLASLNIDPENPGHVVGLLPGSRRKEVQAMLPLFLEGARLLEKEIGKTTFLIPAAEALEDSVFAQCGLSDCGLDIRISRDDRYGLMSACDAVLAASGTVTLELAILKVPMVVSYRVSPISYFLGRKLIKVEFASLVNLVAGRKVVPELLQHDAVPEKICSELLATICDQELRAEMLAGLEKVVADLGGPGASHRAAEIAFETAGFK
ncbi:MAG: lipid-A-disaccharide synthase [Proteobacteria bacterium]|nr:lipid-A-disaccharide synthase [Pseudomonadota bacterium]MBU1739035.1 lipid-A-disaccharide synthase [Pseudomonadota bacterium]